MSVQGMGIRTTRRMRASGAIRAVVQVCLLTGRERDARSCHRNPRPFERRKRPLRPSNAKRSPSERKRNAATMDYD